MNLCLAGEQGVHMSPSAADRWRTLLSDLHTWRRGGKRAVHKPLLTLMIIARAEAGAPARVRFSEIEQDLRKHLREFGPPRKSYHPEFPFWHLQHDGFWKVEDPGNLQAKTGGKSPSCRTLLYADAVATIDPPLWRSLVSSQTLREELAERLLADFWPETIHASIRSELGLAEPGSQSAR